MIALGLLRRGERVLSLETPLLTEPKVRHRRGTVVETIEVYGERTEVRVKFVGIQHYIVMRAYELRRLNLIEMIGDLDGDLDT